MTNTRSHVYVGLAGETAPGRPIKSGLYRMRNDDGEWQLVTRGLPEAPAIRSIAVHPSKPEVVYVGTQSGPYRSTDDGEHWEKGQCPRSWLAGLVVDVPSARPRMSCSRDTKTARSIAATTAERRGGSCR